jgi:predicted nucleic acid-binding protein
MASHPQPTGENLACHQLVMDLLANGHRVILPELADYEIRRELIRAKKVNGLKRLDTLKATLEYLPISTGAMLKAAEFWAEACWRSSQTADDKALDGDVILAAQAVTLGEPDAIVATTNVDHLSRFVAADEWPNIRP